MVDSKQIIFASASGIAEENLALEVNNLGIHYPHFKHREGWVLSGLNFTLAHGETLGIIGSNGAGKSSLLRALAAITEPDAGTVKRHSSSRAALLTLNTGFMPHLPTEENIVLSGMLLGKSRRTMLALVPEILAFAALDVDARQKVGTFSTGMRARLALGVALATAPDIVLIDELLGVGDGAFRKKSAQAIRDMIIADRSVVLVSHNLKTVEELCDRVLWIENGSTRLCGPSDTVVTAYRQYLEQANNQ